MTDLRVVEKRRSKGGTRYYPTIAYAYEVAGQRFIGSRLQFGDAGRITPARAQETLAPFTVGGAVPVDYDPQRLSEATLSTDMRGTAVTEVLGFIMAAAGILAGLFIPLT